MSQISTKMIHVFTRLYLFLLTKIEKSSVSDKQRKNLTEILTFLVLMKRTAWKLSKYGVILGPYFPVFRRNTEIYGVNLRIQSGYSKIRIRNNSVFGHFLCSDVPTKYLVAFFSSMLRLNESILMCQKLLSIGMNK